MKRYIVYIISILLFYSCSNRKTQDFGFETKAIIKQDLFIPEYIYSMFGKKTDTIASTDLYTAPCFIDSGKIKIIASQKTFFNFRFTIDSNNNFIASYYDYFKGNESLYSKEIISTRITNQRMYLNSQSFKIGDTLKCMYYFQIKFNFKDSFCFKNDSIYFSYRIQPKSVMLSGIFDLEFSHYYSLKSNYKGKIPIDFKNDKLIKVDNTLKVLDTIKIVKRRTMSDVQRIKNCFVNNTSVTFLINENKSEDGVIKLSIKNERYDLEYINPEPMMDANTYDVFINQSNFTFNKLSYKIGDIIMCKGYFIKTANNNYTGDVVNILDSLELNSIIRKK
jgi:hypothetical protein